MAQKPLIQNSDGQIDNIAVAPAVNLYYADMSRHTAVSSVQVPKSDIGNSASGVRPCSTMEDQGEKTPFFDLS